MGATVSGELPPGFTLDRQPNTYDEKTIAAQGAAKQSEGVNPNGSIPGYEGNLDPTQAGDNWATIGVQKDGLNLTYVVPTIPGGDNSTQALGARLDQSGQHYGAFETDQAGADFMKNFARKAADLPAGFTVDAPSAAKPSYILKNPEDAAKYAAAAAQIGTDTLPAIAPPPTMPARKSVYGARYDTGLKGAQDALLANAATEAQTPLSEDWANFATQAPAGAFGGVVGLPGNLVSLAGSGVSALGAPFGAPDAGQAISAIAQPFTSQSIENFIAGEPTSAKAQEYRSIGELAGPNVVSNVARHLPLLPTGDVNPNVMALGQRAQDLGVPIRPGQMSASKTMKVWDDQLSRMFGTGYRADRPLRITSNAQQEAYTRALSRTFGEDAPALTQDVMANAHARITGDMNDVLGRNSVAMDRLLHRNIWQIRRLARNSMDEEAARPIIDATERIIDKMTSGNRRLSGRQYLSWRERGGLLSNLTESSNPTIANYGQRLRNELDNAFNRQISGEDAGILRTAREQYRNYKTIAPLAEKAPTGQISPALVLGAVIKEHPNFARSGAGDIGDLGRIGQQFLKEPPNSTTAERSLLMQLISNPFRAAGTLAGLPLSSTVGRTISGAINSPRYLERLHGIPGPIYTPPTTLQLTPGAISSLNLQFNGEQQ